MTESARGIATLSSLSYASLIIAPFAVVDGIFFVVRRRAAADVVLANWHSCAEAIGLVADELPELVWVDCVM
ncbi:MAG: hypothetical protein RBR22_00610 [Desulfuromonas sp.]|nr:hypothetical protein [Desulfuromonas sp.]